MKTLFITLTTTIALTHAAHASNWMWFHGDIGLSSPFGSSSSPANNAATEVVPKRKTVTKQKAASKRSVTGPSDSASSRVVVHVRFSKPANSNEIVLGSYE